MSLTKCLKKAGKAIDAKDRKAIESLVEGGMSELEAVQQHLNSLNDELTSITDQVQEQGGKVLFQDQPVDQAVQRLNENLRDGRMDIVRYIKGFEGKKKSELIDLFVDVANQHESLFIPGESEFVLGYTANKRISRVWDKDGNAYTYIDGKATPNNTELEPNSDLSMSDGITLNVLSKVARDIKEQDPTVREQQRVESLRREEIARRQDRLKNVPRMPPDFDQALQDLADWADNLEEFKAALNPDMFDISDRNLNRLGRATLALEPDSFENAGKGEVTIYRALPRGEEIEAGDWVSFNKEYASGHETNVGEEGGVTESIEVPGTDVWWYGADENEWVYIPEGTWDVDSIEELWANLTGGKKPDAYPLVEGKKLYQDATTLDLEGIKSKYPDVTLSLFERGESITLNKIIVPEKMKGTGSAVMNDLVRYADTTGKKVVLDPDTSLGASSKKRLVDFYKRFGFVENKGKNRDYEISNDMYREPQAKALEQEGETQPRGQIEFLPERAVIKLSRSSDLSTFLHESGHLFLELESKFAATNMTKDHETILEFLGVDSFADIKTEQHEKFARGFEAYLREGKSPSLALRDAFANFKRWLTIIYRKLSGLDVEINDDIRQVFDRMLATEREIEEAYSNPAYDQFFKSKEQLGKSDAEWEKYQKQVKRAKNAASEDLDRKLIEEVTRLRTREWEEERAPLVDEERERLSKMRPYQVMDNLITEPMDYDALKEQVGFTKQPGKLIGKIKKGGVDPEEYAEVYGYRSVQEMYEELINTPALKQAATDAAQQRMIERHGDILNDGTIEQEVRQAVHNEEQARLLLMEVRALGRGNRMVQSINRDYLKAETKKAIGELSYKEIQPGKFYRAEIKAAQNAAMADNKAEQLNFKIQQLTNHYLYKEAVAVRDAMKKQISYIKKVQKREYSTNQVSAEYVQNMKAMASMYTSKKQQERQQFMKDLITWHETQMNDPNQFLDITVLDLNLIKAIAHKQDARDAGKDWDVSQLNIPSFEALTADEMRGAYDMIRHLRYVGGAMADAAKAKTEAERSQFIQSINDNGGKDYTEDAGAKSPFEDQKNSIQSFFLSLTSLRNFTRKLDGFKNETGFANENIFMKVEDASGKEMVLRNKAYDVFESELSDIHQIGLNRKKNQFQLEDGRTLNWGTEHVFMAALNWGTESNREAMREGFGLTDTDMQNILGSLTKDQLATVNAIWKLNESYWPELSEASVKRYGVSPQKLDATPFTVNGVEMTGGHMRLFYDDVRTELDDEFSVGNTNNVTVSKAGSLYERIGSGGKAVSLDKNNIVRALEENIHFIAYAEATNDIGRIINNKDVQAAIIKKHGKTFLKSLIENLQLNVSNYKMPEMLGIRMVTDLSRLIRKAATYKHLSWSVRNVMQQFTAITPVIQDLGGERYMKAVLNYTQRFDEINEFVSSNSKFMKDRETVVNREAAEYLKGLTVDGRIQDAWNKFGQYGFFFQSTIDRAVSTPAWIAKYEQKMEEHGDHKLAVSEANTFVSETVGSGLNAHLGALMHQNQSQLVKTFTVFGSWFNMYYNRVYRDTGGYSKEFMAAHKRQAFATIVTSPIIIAALSAALVADMPDSLDLTMEGDDEGLMEWLTNRYVGFMAGTVPVLRDVVGSFYGFTPKSIISTGQAVPGKLWAEVEAYSEDKQTTMKFVSDTIKATTTVAPFPGAGNVTNVLSYIDSYNQGNEGNNFNMYQALVEGPDR